MAGREYKPPRLARVNKSPMEEPARDLSRTLWLMRPEDIQSVERRYLYLTYCERPDPPALRSADWVRFRRALTCFLQRGDQRSPAVVPDPVMDLLQAPLTTPDDDEREAAKFCSGYTKRIGPDVLMLIISSYPDTGILEVDLFAHQAVELYPGTARGARNSDDEY